MYCTGTLICDVSDSLQTNDGGVRLGSLFAGVLKNIWILGATENNSNTKSLWHRVSRKIRLDGGTGLNDPLCCRMITSSCKGAFQDSNVGILAC